MMALGLRFGWKLLSSRLGLAAVLCALLWGWHVYDKRQAISAAREGFVQQFELTASPDRTGNPAPSHGVCRRGKPGSSRADAGGRR